MGSERLCPGPQALAWPPKQTSIVTSLRGRGGIELEALPSSHQAREAVANA